MENIFAKIAGMPYVLTGFIVGVALVGWIYIRYQKKQGNLVLKRRWIEQIPSLVSTLGVLGTFFGITIGLLDFNSNDLQASIPKLLDGLKTGIRNM
mgnify:FL=1